MADIGSVQQRNAGGINAAPQQSAPAGNPGHTPPNPRLDAYISNNLRELNGGGAAAWEAFGKFAQQARMSPREALDAVAERSFGILGPAQTDAFMTGFRGGVTGGGRPNGYDPQRFNPRANNPNLDALALP